MTCVYSTSLGHSVDTVSVVIILVVAEVLMLPQSEMREEATCARTHSIKSSCSPATRQKAAANVPR